MARSRTIRVTRQGRSMLYVNRRRRLLIHGGDPLGLYNWMFEYRWGPAKTDLAAESKRIRRQIREAKARRKENGMGATPFRSEPTEQERGAPSE